MANRPATPETLIAEVTRLQAIQKAHPPASAAWQDASKALQPLFAQLAEMQRSGHYAASRF